MLHEIQCPNLRPTFPFTFFCLYCFFGSSENCSPETCPPRLFCYQLSSQVIKNFQHNFCKNKASSVNWSSAKLHLTWFLWHVNVSIAWKIEWLGRPASECSRFLSRSFAAKKSVIANNFGAPTRKLIEVGPYVAEWQWQCSVLFFFAILFSNLVDSCGFQVLLSWK